MTKKIYTLDEIKKIAFPIFEKYPSIRSAYLFGSYARGEANENSDLDFMLVLNDCEFDTYRKAIIVDVDLADIFKKPVDIITERELQQMRSKKIMNERKLVYEQRNKSEV